MVCLIDVGDFWTVVCAVQHPVQVEVCFIQPHANIGLVPLVEGMHAKGSVCIGSERDDGRAACAGGEGGGEVVAGAAARDGPVPRSVGLSLGKEHVEMVAVVDTVKVGQGEFA